MGATMGALVAYLFERSYDHTIAQGIFLGMALGACIGNLRGWMIWRVERQQTQDRDRK